MKRNRDTSLDRPRTIRARIPTGTKEGDKPGWQEEAREATLALHEALVTLSQSTVLRQSGHHHG